MSLAETAAVASAAASSVAAVNSESTLEPGLEETEPVQLDSLSKPADSSASSLSISVSVSAAAISSASSIIATEANSSTTGEAEAAHQEHNNSERPVDFQHAKNTMTARTPSSPLPSMASVSEDSGAAVKQEPDTAAASLAKAEAESQAPSSSAPTSSSTATSPTPLSSSPLSSTMVTIDKGHPIPTSNALSSSLKSRLSASAPLSSLSSVTPTTIISPKPYPPFIPAATASLSSFSKSDSTQRARGASSVYSAYPTHGSKHDDIHIKSPPPTDNRQLGLHSAAGDNDRDEEAESEEEYEVVEEEEYEAMEGYSELESESGTVLGMDHDSGHPDEQDTDMIDVSAGSSSPPPSVKDSTLPSSSAPGRERPVSPGSPSTVASGDGPFSISAGGSGSKSPSPRLAPQQPDAADSPRSVKSPGGGIKKDSKAGVTATTCANCGTTSTPLWRRASDGQTICNACGLYFKARNLTRPPWLKRNMVLKKDEEGEDAEGQASSSASATASKDGVVVAGSSPSNASEKSAEEAQQATTTAPTYEKEKPSEACPGDGSCKTNGGQPCTACAGVTQQQTGRQNLVCANCRTTTTPLWRRDSSGNTICNACGLYFKLHNVHRPVTMKRAVIKRRKRVNVLANSPPLVPQQAIHQQQQQQRIQQQQQQQQRMQHPSHPHPHPHHQPPPQYHQRLQYPKPLPRPRSPPAVSSIESNGHDGQGDHTGSAAKRRRIQSSNDPRGEEYILPKPPVNSQPEWSRSGNHRRSMSPIENIGSSEQDHHHPGAPHHHGSPYSQPSSRGQDPHGHMRDHPPHPNQPPRYPHHGGGQYVPQSMTMSRYPMYPPPPPRQHQPGPPPSLQQHPHPSQQHPQSSHSHAPPSHPQHPQHHQPPHHMHHQAPHGYPQSAHSPRDMDDGMHPSSQHSSGWNQRLPGYATVSSSSSNTRLSSTGIVHSTGPPPSSPPLYPRYSHGGSQASYHHQPYYGQGSSQQGHDYHPSESPQPQASAPPPPPPPSQGGHHYSSGSSPVQGASLPSSSGYATPYSERERGGSSVNGAGGPTHLPPISLPHPAHAGHHQALPRPADLMHATDQAPSSSHHHQFGQHRRQPSSPSTNMNGVAIGAPGSHPPPPPAPPTAPSAHAGVPANTDVLQQTRQDLQREVSHLSMLLGRAAAVLSGLDQALDPHMGAAQPPPAAHSMHEGGSPISHGYAAPHPPPPSHGHGGPMHVSAAPQAGAPGPLTSDVTTNSALASLMALSSSGGPGHAGVSARHDDREMQHHHGLPPPPPRYPQSMSYSSYPLPRRS
ncbi:unnamed protein product [Mortierella alpina]